jgi:hypothetical protein
MATGKTIPYKGEMLNTQHPSALQVAQITVGCDTTFDINLLDTTGRNTDETYALFSVPIDTFVMEVACAITTAFTTNGSLQVGDGSDSDGWLTDTAMEPATTNVAGKFTGTNEDTAAGYSGGKIYNAADTIDLYTEAGSATIAAGNAIFLLMYARDVGSDSD